MKIAYTIKSLGNPAGIERTLSTKANYFAEQAGYEVHIIVAKPQPQSLFYYFSPKVTIHYLGINANNRNVYMRKTEELLQHIKPDITISTFGPDASFLYKLNDGSPKVLEFHFTRNYLKHLCNSLRSSRLFLLRKCWLRCLQWKEEHIASKYEHIVLLTQKDKRLWGGGDKFAVIPNPLSFNTEKKSSLNTNTIVAMGRLVYPKGFQYLIRAFTLIHKQHPDWRVEIYGEGHDWDLLQKEIYKRDLQDKIKLLPPVEDVKNVLLNASLFVHPSLYDGFGLVLTEAMACGVPCIAFDCDCGPAEIISDNEDGLLVKLKNTRRLADKMNLLMSDNELRAEMGAKAQENVKRYSIEKVGKQWEKLFNQLTVNSHQ